MHNRCTMAAWLHGCMAVVVWLNVLTLCMHACTEHICACASRKGETHQEGVTGDERSRVTRCTSARHGRTSPPGALACFPVWRVRWKTHATPKHTLYHDALESFAIPHDPQ